MTIITQTQIDFLDEILILFGGIPYTAHGAQIIPLPLLIFDAVYFLFLCLF